MAGAYKCDICGALFAERPLIEQDVTWYLAQTVDRGYEHPADMCKVCLDNLQLWVKNKGRYMRTEDVNRDLLHACGRYKVEIERLRSQLRDAKAKMEVDE